MSHTWIRFAGTLALNVGLVAQITRTPITPTHSEDGAEMFQAYCASCHGTNGKGHGPASKALKIPATDLTKLALYHDGQFPSIPFLTTLSKAGGAHGNEEMPVWSDVFRLSGHSDATVQMRLYNLMRYVETMQDPPAKAKPAKAKEPDRPSVTSISPVSGGAMFRAYCSSCHGLDGRGGGAIAWTLKGVPADLSLLAKSNGGGYPRLLVINALEKGSQGAAHGSAEMPVWGQIFRNAGESDAMRQVRIRNLVEYIEGLQRK